LLLIQITELEQSRDAELGDENPDRAAGMIQQLAKLRGVGVQSATVLVREGECADRDLFAASYHLNFTTDLF
jgi:hypothetical protein